MRTEDIPEFRKLCFDMGVRGDAHMVDGLRLAWEEAIRWMTKKDRIAEEFLGNRCTEVIVEDGQLNATQRQLEECQQELLSLKLALLREGYPC